MVSEKADFGERVVTRTMYYIEFLVLGAYSICLTGAIDVCIFLWKNGVSLCRDHQLVFWTCDECDSTR
jgi:hypothetical protein